MVSKKNRNFRLGLVLMLLSVVIAAVMVPLEIPTWVWAVTVFVQVTCIFFGALLMGLYASGKKHGWRPTQTLPESGSDDER